MFSTVNYFKRFLKNNHAIKDLNQEEHPPVGIILTAEEILEEYGSEKES